MIFWALLAAALGAAVGSFLQLVADRARPAGPVNLRARSRCPGCAAVLRGTDTLPVVGFLRLRGRCRWCRSLIPRRHLLGEVLWAGWWAVMVVLVGTSPWLVVVLATPAAPLLLRPVARVAGWRWRAVVAVVPVSVALLIWGLGGLLAGSWEVYATGGASGGAGLLMALVLTASRTRAAAVPPARARSHSESPTSSVTAGRRSHLPRV